MLAGCGKIGTFTQMVGMVHNLVCQKVVHRVKPYYPSVLFLGLYDRTDRTKTSWTKPSI